MLDSSDQDEEFDDLQFTLRLSSKTKVLINTFDIKFMEGWAAIVQSFIQEIGGFKVSVIEITDEHGFLEIEVDLLRTTKALQVYKSILKAKHLSMRTCAYCGKTKSESSIKYCGKCHKIATKLKITGTWLDSFVGSDD